MEEFLSINKVFQTGFWLDGVFIEIVSDKEPQWTMSVWRIYPTPPRAIIGYFVVFSLIF